MEEALLGFSREIVHLDGHKVTVKSQGVSQPFSWQILKDEGMPVRGSGGDYGELHVKLIVNFPSRLSPQQREIALKIFGHSPQSPIKTVREEEL